MELFSFAFYQVSIGTRHNDKSIVAETLGLAFVLHAAPGLNMGSIL